MVSEPKFHVGEKVIISKSLAALNFYLLWAEYWTPYCDRPVTIAKHVAYAHDRSNNSNIYIYKIKEDDGIFSWPERMLIPVNPFVSQGDLQSLLCNT